MSLASTKFPGFQPGRLLIFRSLIENPLNTLNRTSPMVTLRLSVSDNLSDAIAFNFDGGNLMGMMMAAAMSRTRISATKAPTAFSMNLKNLRMDNFLQRDKRMV